MTKQSTWLMEGSEQETDTMTECSQTIIYDVRPTEGQCQEEKGEHHGSDYTPWVGSGH